MNPILFIWALILCAINAMVAGFVTIILSLLPRISKRGLALKPNSVGKGNKVSMLRRTALFAKARKRNGKAARSKLSADQQWIEKIPPV